MQLLLAAPVTDGSCAGVAQQPLLLSAAREVCFAKFDRRLFEETYDERCANPSGLVQWCVAPPILHHHMCTALLDKHADLHIADDIAGALETQTKTLSTDLLPPASQNLLVVAVHLDAYCLMTNTLSWDSGYHTPMVAMSLVEPPPAVGACWCQTLWQSHSSISLPLV